MRDKKVMKKIFIFLLLSVVLLSACSFPNHNEEKKEFAWADTAFMRIGNTQFDKTEALIYLDATRKQYEQLYGKDIWDYRIETDGSTIGDGAKAQTLEDIIYLKIVCSKADELNVFLSGEELDEVDKKAEEYMKSLEGSEILKQGVNLAAARRVYQDNLLATKVYEKATLNIEVFVSDEDATQAEKEEIIAEKRKEAFRSIFEEWKANSDYEINLSVWGGL